MCMIEQDGGAARADVAEPLSSVPAALPSEQLPAVQDQGAPLLSAIIKVACDPALDVAKLDALLRMQAELEKRQAEREWTEAFARLSAKMPRVKKTGVIDLGVKGQIPFAKWDEMDKIIRPLLASEGFALSFNTAAKEGGGLVVTGKLMHRAGHSETASIPLPLDQGPGRNNLQAVGSTLSYGKRYCAENLLNIVREGDDDDGNKGGTRFISGEEAEEIRGLMKDTKTDETRFCTNFNIAHLAEMPAANLAIARNMLLAKKGRAA